ncbi:MAG: hemolysin family protein [Planctomycetaceae bacterium]|nr:hemolysin family protein [Planctomycetaceae bacterium]
MDFGAGWELLVILLLILLNGFFAAAEIAILTARRGRLEQLANDGDGAAQVAIDLAADSDQFLPTVQVGITVVSTLASVYGGARIEEQLAAWIATSPWPWLAAQNHTLAITTVVVGLAFCSLILGELVPKRFALQNAEPLARIVAYPMLFVQRASRPVILLLQFTTRVVLRLLGQDTHRKQTVSVEDIQHLIDAGTEAGVLGVSQHKVAKEALRLGDRTLSEFLRPRIDIDAIDIDTPSEEVIGSIAMSGFSRVPVCEGNIDHIIGFVYIKDVFLQQYLGRPIDLRRLVRPPLFVPKTLNVTRLLELFKENKTQLAIVLDEYGGTQGMVTMEDVFEMLVGNIHDEHRGDHIRDQAQSIVRREDGTWLIDGLVNLHELQQTLSISRWTEAVPRGVGTLSGLVIGVLKRPPKVGDVLEWSDLKIEIVDMDGPRIDRLLVQPTSKEDDVDESSTRGA